MEINAQDLISSLSEQRNAALDQLASQIAITRTLLREIDGLKKKNSKSETTTAAALEVTQPFIKE